MFLKGMLLIIFISLYPNLLQTCTGQSTCTSLEIFQNNTDSCVCRDFLVGQCANRCQVTSPQCSSKLSGIYLGNCISDCTSPHNKDCDSCGIWLSSLCTCLQHPTWCEHSASSGKVWIKLAGGNIATVNLPIPNILDLQNNHEELAKIGWDFGQRASKPISEALAINPARTITQDQIHMHICPINTNMQTFLSGKTPPSSLTAIQLPGQFQHLPGPTEMWCLASQTKDTPIDGSEVFEAIHSVLEMKGTCGYDVSAAVIRDTNGYTWACVTADSGDTEHRFCS
ncbi:hypothetical protein TRVA0_021S02344 [Trichomonascus vanleenenianus]|uniref:uncharacterized protein n=1 Tax=Trichomonascus vanleenenianus TaxID=2268995 RepID=UPI003ECAAD41